MKQHGGWGVLLSGKTLAEHAQCLGLILSIESNEDCHRAICLLCHRRHLNETTWLNAGSIWWLRRRPETVTLWTFLSYLSNCFYLWRVGTGTDLI